MVINKFSDIEMQLLLIVASRVEKETHEGPEKSRLLETFLEVQTVL